MNGQRGRYAYIMQKNNSFLNQGGSRRDSSFAMESWFNRTSVQQGLLIGCAQFPIVFGTLIFSACDLYFFQHWSICVGRLEGKQSGRRNSVTRMHRPLRLRGFLSELPSASRRQKNSIFIVLSSSTPFSLWIELQTVPALRTVEIYTTSSCVESVCPFGFSVATLAVMFFSQFCSLQSSMEEEQTIQLSQLRFSPGCCLIVGR